MDMRTPTFRNCFMLSLAAGILLSLAAGILLSQKAAAQTINGFDLSNATIPLKEIMSGGPPRDGIPSIDRPKFIPVIKSYFWLRLEPRAL